MVHPATNKQVTRAIIAKGNFIDFEQLTILREFPKQESCGAADGMMSRMARVRQTRSRGWRSMIRAWSGGRTTSNSAEYVASARIAVRLGTAPTITGQAVNRETRSAPKLQVVGVGEVVAKARDDARPNLLASWLLAFSEITSRPADLHC
jgi:hypothetical protein